MRPYSFRAMKIEKYELVKPLGQGGFAKVYQARDCVLGRTVAVKVCQTTDQEGLERFFREARLTGSLQHPNIAQVLDFGVENGVPYIVQEFLPGQDLAELLRQGRLPLPLALSILVQVARGLAHAHGKHVLHRDIKPSNVRVLPSGLVKIIDFGIGRLMQDDSRLTRTGEALGTVGYFSPEILLGQVPDQRADIFSFGTMAYEVLSGQHPFLSEDLGNTLYNIVHKNPPPLIGAGVNCPPRLAEIVTRCLAKDLGERWPSSQALTEALEEVAHELQVEVGMVLPEPVAAAGETALASASALPTAQRLLHAYGTPLGLFLTGTALVALALVGLGHGPRTSEREYPPASMKPTVPPPMPPAVTSVPTPSPASEVEVEIMAIPPAFVVIGDRELGKVARKMVRLTPGSYQITFSIPGYRTERRTVLVQNDTREILLTMPPFGFLSVVPDLDTPLTGTRVFVDDRLLGPLPIVSAKLPEGDHQLKVTWPDGSVFQLTFNVGPERVTTLTVTKPR